MGLCRAQRGSSAPGRGSQDPPSEGAGGPEPPLPPQDYISLFPLDDTQPSKLMRLLSSNEEDANILSSPSKCGQRRGGVVVPGDGSVLPHCSFLGVKCVSAQKRFSSQAGQVKI